MSKWYMDCVSDEGSTFMGYLAHVRWGPLAFCYSASLLHPCTGRTRSSFSLWPSPAPQDSSSCIEWSARRLGVHGTWIPLAEPFQQTLLRDRAGEVTWRCAAPLAQALVTLDGGHDLRGLGYVEQLTMTLPPHRLPIDRLLWGRFQGDGSAVVWIRWEGQHPLSLVIETRPSPTGRAATRIIPRARVEAHGLTLPCGTLKLNRSHVIRDACLRDDALRPLRLLHPLLPSRLLEARERKWIGPSIKTVEGSRDVSGWAIHEEVTWPSKRPS